MAQTGLEKLVEEMEEKTGKFSQYKCAGGKSGQDIEFRKKPAQQFLAAQGGTSNPAKPLTELNPQHKNKTKDVEISGFLEGKSKLQIEKARVAELKASAKVYTNPNVINSNTYSEAMRGQKLTSQDRSDGISADGKEEPWQNLAVGVCHAQKIDLLAEQSIENGEAVTAERKGKIKAGDPSITLLSTPALNFKYGAAKGMNPEKASALIENMFRTVFAAAQAEGCSYITMPAAGLGVFGGTTDQYFNAIFNVAKEYPHLNIIYHPGHPKNGPDFDKGLQEYANNGGKNVAKATKDVVFLADNLNKTGYKCAVHNPSDADVVLGVNDVGQYWKNGKGANYVGEEHIGAMSTAPLNSKGLNPDIYLNPTTLNLAQTKEQTLKDTTKTTPEPVSKAPPSYEEVKKSKATADKSDTPDPATHKRNPPLADQQVSAKSEHNNESKNTENNNAKEFFSSDEKKISYFEKHIDKAIKKGDYKGLNAMNKKLGEISKELNDILQFTNSETDQPIVHHINGLQDRIQALNSKVDKKLGIDDKPFNEIYKSFNEIKNTHSGDTFQELMKEEMNGFKDLLKIKKKHGNTPLDNETKQDIKATSNNFDTIVKNLSKLDKTQLNVVLNDLGFKSKNSNCKSVLNGLKKQAKVYEKMSQHVLHSKPELKAMKKAQKEINKRREFHKVAKDANVDERLESASKGKDATRPVFK